MQKALGPGLRRVGVPIAHFGGKGIDVQPIEQFCAERGDDVELRRVHVGVDEPWSEQMAAPVDARPVRARRRLGRQRPGDAAILDQQLTARDEAHWLARIDRESGVGGEVGQIGLYRKAKGVFGVLHVRWVLAQPQAPRRRKCLAAGVPAGNFSAWCEKTKTKLYTKFPPSAMLVSWFQPKVDACI
ncbi:hypothetical protein GALL_527080 [mine drainage metagenome]|uniref:Uncharacterized protein n=1 Tax=mine drainage metagenome TaxID=410659 RepID=A0A1J5P3Q3_9ZZZZ